MIANNGGRLGKTLWTEREAGEKVRVMGVWDGPEEARFVGERIETHIAGGGRAEDCAILVRAQFQTREFEDRSEEHTSELQSLMRISYAVFCLKKKTHRK